MPATHFNNLLRAMLISTVALATTIACLALRRHSGGEATMVQLGVSTAAGAMSAMMGSLQLQQRRRAADSLPPGDSASRGLQGLFALRSKPHEELARQAMRLEILLAQMASNRSDVLDVLLGAVQLGELSQTQLALHTARLQQLVNDKAAAARARAAALPRAGGSASLAPPGQDGPSGTGEAASAPEQEGADTAAQGCQRADLPELCYAFEACNITKVAIVGNGPLSAEQRQDLRSGAYQVVVRFNFMNNRAAGEQVDVWVMRNADNARLHFWGISQMDPPDAREAVAAAKSIWFLGKLHDNWDTHWYLMQPVYRQYPQVKARHHMVLDPDLTEGFELLNGEAMLGGQDMSPSTGWYGASFALECSTRIGAEVHVFGFNWNAAHADEHTISDEHRLFRAAEREGMLFIHSTACDGLRSCSADAKHKDCHLVSAEGQEVYNCTNTNLGLKQDQQ